MAEPKTVDHVDVQRYMGTWYEIARFPQKFENGLVGVTANYTLRPDGKVDVLNSGRKGDLKAELKSIKGKAKVADPATNAKIKVTFFWPFSADYWIIDLGKEYDYAVVSNGKRNTLWILSRTPKMDAKLYDQIVARLKDNGFDVTKLEKVPQPDA
jgi:apolipoprotein D and lipocalin family protein